MCLNPRNKKDSKNPIKFMMKIRQKKQWEMINHKILLLMFCVFYIQVAYTQKDIFFIKGLPKEIISQNIKICKIYSYGKKKKEIKIEKRYNKKGLLISEINYDNKNITKYSYNTNERIKTLIDLLLRKKEKYKNGKIRSTYYFYYNKNNMLIEKKIIYKNNRKELQEIYDYYYYK